MTNGLLSQAQFNTPNGLLFDKSGFLYVADTGNHSIRKIDLNKGTVTTVAGNGTKGHLDGALSTALFEFPRGLTMDKNGNLYVSQDTRIRKIDFKQNTVTTIAGTGKSGNQSGPALSAQFNTVHRILLDSNGDLLISDTDNHCIRKLILR